MQPYGSAGEYWNNDSPVEYHSGGYSNHSRQISAYPPVSTVLRPDQHSERDPPPSLAWHGLNLSGHQLRTLSPALGQFSHITELYLLNNQLRELPKALFTGLLNLTRLDVSQNQLVVLPVEIENLQRLKHLLLEKNCLTSLPMELGRLWRYAMAPSSFPFR
jgi:Leucine-rich repeat (LRR) protein